MKKRSAMMIAAGLVASLLAGAVALATGFSGGNTAVADTPTGRVEPRVRTVERTITIHKKAKPDQTPVVQTIPAPASATATQPAVASATDDALQATSDDEGWDEDGSEDEGFEDESEDGDDQGEDHEDEDEQHEDEDEGPEDD